MIAFEKKQKKTSISQIHKFLFFCKNCNIIKIRNCWNKIRIIIKAKQIKIPSSAQRS